MEGECKGEDEQGNSAFLPPLPAGGALAPRLGPAPESSDQPDADDLPARTASDRAKPGAGEQDPATSDPDQPGAGEQDPATSDPAKPGAGEQDPATSDPDQQASKPDAAAPIRPKPVWKPPAQPPAWRRPVAKNGRPASAKAPDKPGPKQPVARQGTGLTLPASTNARSKRVPQKIRPLARQQPDLGPYEQVAQLALSIVTVLAVIGLLTAWIILELRA